MDKIEVRIWDSKWKRMYYQKDTKISTWYDCDYWELERLFENGDHAEEVMIDQKKVTMMLWAGLFDKNGKKIFDSDIVRCHKFTQELGENLGVTEGEKEFIAKIEFSTYGGTQVVTSSGDYMFVWEFEEGWHEESLEVIGNVYENPKLMDLTNTR